MNKEIKRIKYFIPNILRHIEISETDEIIFTNHSERGVLPPLIDERYLDVFGENWCFVLQNGKFLWNGIVINSRLHNKQKVDGWMVLMEAKSWQGVMMEEWEQGILDGSVPYWTLLGGENPNDILPRIIIDFIKKELFKGIDKELIESTYQKVLKHWTWWRVLLFRVKRYFNYA